MAAIDPVDEASIPARLIADATAETRYIELLNEIYSLLDARPYDLWPRHAHRSAASIAVAAVYRAVGGKPPGPMARIARLARRSTGGIAKSGTIGAVVGKQPWRRAVLRLSVSPEDLAAMMRGLWFGAAAGKAEDRQSRRAAECDATGCGMDALIGLPADELERFRTLMQPVPAPGMVTDLAEFPADAMRLLGEAGALTAPLPIA